jgi:P-type E1-E2 ATPase
MLAQLTCCGERRSVPVTALGGGDRVFVAKAHRVPVDGIIAEGSAYVQEIAHTGEPFPVVKATGDSVLAGTVALDGDLIVVVGMRPAAANSNGSTNGSRRRWLKVRDGSTRPTAGWRGLSQA